MSPVTGLVTATFCCLGISMLCSLCEAVLYSVPLTLVRSGAEAGHQSLRIMLELKERPGRPIAGILISNTIANTLGATMAGVYAKQVWHDTGAAIFAGGLTFCILFFSEIIPKTVGVAFCRPLAGWVAWPIRFFVWFWTPVIVLTEVVTRAIQHRAGDEGALSEWELAALMRQGVQDGTFREQEARIVQQVLQLDTHRTRDIMTPRTVMVTAPAELTLAEAAARRELWRYARVPVYEGDPDRIVGVVLRSDVLLNPDDTTRTLGEVAGEVFAVPETMRVDVLLEKLIADRRHLALVVDEYGQYEGLVTLEDVIETLLGREIVDELDTVADLREEAVRRAERRREELGLGEPAGQGDSSAPTK